LTDTTGTYLAAVAGTYLSATGGILLTDIINIHYIIENLEIKI
jgi:hypothetical protein